MMGTTKANRAGLWWLTLCWLTLCSLTLGCQNQAEGKASLPAPTGSALPKLDVPNVAQVPAKGAALEEGRLRGTGTLYPNEKAELGPKATGVITRLTVEEGDRVKKGQLLFTLDGQQAALSVEQAKASLNAAQINLTAAELDYGRTKELMDRGSVSPATFDQAKTRYDGAQSQVEQAKVVLSQARKGASDTAVTSPIDGVVSAKLKSVGELATMMPPTVVVIVEDVSRLELRARLPERALGEVESGARFRATFPAIGETRELSIGRINPSVDPRARTIEVVSMVDNADGKLRPGMLVELSFEQHDPQKERRSNGGGGH